ncbi:MAG: AmmeMemoRadiSam system protein B [Bacteroidales bacterium]
MMKKVFYILMILILVSSISCKKNPESSGLKTRNVVDTIGFAQYDWQMDSIIERIGYHSDSEQTWRVAITPHDDYAYVGDLYPRVLDGVKAKTVILFGVAHKARDYDLENRIIFDSFDVWQAPYGKVKVSEIRNKLIKAIPDSLFMVHDKMQSVEHSLEAVIPFLQNKNPDIEIIPILVPYMTYEKMQQISGSFSDALKNVMKENNLQWGKDLAMVISTDAVHYGDEDWGGSNYAPFGTDSAGLASARNHEMEIITNCLVGEINPGKIKKFINYTVKEENYKEYKWTWCGRYSVPFGLLAAYKLDNVINEEGLHGTFIGYSNSIDHPTLKVDDLNMGTTAPANQRHWVGYAAVSYE